MPWPEDKFFYLLSSDGLFRCRNHEFFQSCVPMKDGPKELASQKKFCRVSYPKIPQALVEKAVGFFHLVADKQNSEAAVLWVWNRQTKQVEMIVPDQTGINGSPSKSQPHGWPMDVKYEIPILPHHLSLIGDMHCHVDGSAYASFTDENDETHRPGIHIVVGHIEEEPPMFYCDVVADGERFSVTDMKSVWEGYSKRRLNEVPLEWLDKVKLKEKKWSYGGSHIGTSSYGGTDYGYSGYSGGLGYSSQREPDEADEAVIKRLLSNYSKSSTCPNMEDVRQNLYMSTKVTPFRVCQEKAEKFVAAWGKKHHEKQAA